MYAPAMDPAMPHRMATVRSRQGAWKVNSPRYARNPAGIITTSLGNGIKELSTDKNRRGVPLIEKVEDACHHYHENRINPMDKSILLIAIAEILYFDDIPPVVSVSEAAGLARKYSTLTSADFVNGVLAGIINK